MKFVLGALLLSCAVLTANADEAQPIEVRSLGFTPQIDGDLSEWQTLKSYKVNITPAKENDAKNKTGTIDVELWAGINDGKVHIAAKWPDSEADTDFRPWDWRRKKYKRSKKRDDMFALRFAMTGDYNRSMIADANYEVDVWVWSAGRSNQYGKAIDYKHKITLAMIENAAEYKSDSGKTVYIDRNKDTGNIGYKTDKPGKKKSLARLPSIKVTNDASGSAADVDAKGVWKDGFWTLELSRLLDTGNEDDAALSIGLEILGQIAVFNKSGAQHKSVSEPLLFKFIE